MFRALSLVNRVSYSLSSWWVPKSSDLKNILLKISQCEYTQHLRMVQTAQSLSYIQLFVTPWIAAHQASLSITNSQSLLRLMCIESVMAPNHLSSPSSPAPNPSQHQGLFQWVNSTHELTKVLEFQLQHQSFQWTPRTDLP